MGPTVCEKKAARPYLVHDICRASVLASVLALVLVPGLRILAVEAHKGKIWQPTKGKIGPKIGPFRVR